MKKNLLSIIALSALILVACKEPKPENPATTTPGFELAFEAIPTLQASHQYFVWLVGPIAANSSAEKPDTVLVHKTFGAPSQNGEDVGPLSAQTFSVDEDALNKATAIIVSIERANTTPKRPSAALLAGTITNGKADLKMDHKLAFGEDFLTQLGTTRVKALFKSFTGTATEADSSAGLWFVGNAEGTTAGITGLPSLPAGFKYEGWLIKNGHPEVIKRAVANSSDPQYALFPFSVGKFTSATGADEDGNKYGGTTGTSPAFPGGDFVANPPTGYPGTFPRSITNGDAMVISIEPADDDSPLPFGYKPFGQITAPGFFAAFSFPTNFDKAVVRGATQGLLFVVGLDARVKKLKGTFTKK